MKPPELMTPAHYTNWMPFQLVKTSTGFSITSRPTPRRAIAVTAIGAALFFIGFAILVYYKGQWRGAFGLTLALGILTTIGMSLSILCNFWRQQRLGPVLVFDARERTFDLPRVSRHFTVEEVDGFCLVTAGVGDEWCSQLQLHTVQDDRFLLVPAWTREELEPMLKAMLSEVLVRASCHTEDRKAPEGWRKESFNVG